MRDNLFDTADNSGPLADRMRPRTLDDFVGQTHILGHGRLLRRAITADRLSALILAGPPGCGKTTLAHIIARSTNSAFFSLNAVLSGLDDLRRVIEKAQELKKLYARKTILFIDEVHRWSKAQQDALLPWTENGTIILIGATTENPYFKVNRALVSRCHIFQMTALTEEDLFKAARLALKDEKCGYGKYDIEISDEALLHLVRFSGGDCRSLLNALELAVETTPSHFPPPPGEKIVISQEIAEDSIQRKSIPYDPSGDDHYDTISAFIKSIRGSDPDAAFYWLAQMLHRGEDPDYIWRRLLILASEDVGLADIHALSVVNQCLASFERIGMPEGYYPLAHAVLYLATCKKSNSVMGFFDALKEVESASRGDVPNHLRDSNRDAGGFGHGQGYKYPHSYQDHWVAQQYLPAALRGRIFYHPSEEGYEKEIKRRVLRRREIQLARGFENSSGENYVALPKHTAIALSWWQRSALYTGQALEGLRKKLFDVMGLASHSCICIYGDSAGYLISEALRRYSGGQVYALLASEQEAQAIRFLTGQSDLLHQPQIYIAQGYERIPDSPDIYEAVVLYRPSEEPEELIPLLQEQLGSDSVLALVFPARAVSLAQVFADFLTDEQQGLLRRAEEKSIGNSWDEKWLTALRKSDFNVEKTDFSSKEKAQIPPAQIRQWLSPDASPGKFLRDLADDDTIAGIIQALTRQEVTVIWPRDYRLLICRKNKKDGV